MLLVREYQRAAMLGYVNPKLVTCWYYVPALGAVGASRFIGYRNMTAERYEQRKGEMDGRVTQPHLDRTRWFRRLEEGEPEYAQAFALAERLAGGCVAPKAKFWVLDSALDERLTGIR